MVNTTKEEIIKTIRNYKDSLEKEYGIKEIGLFGSFVNGVPDDESDIDILVDFIETYHDEMSLFDFLDLKEKLEEMLKHNVDLVMKSSLKKAIKKRILNEVIYA